MFYTQEPRTFSPPFAFPPAVLVVDESTDTHNLLREAVFSAGYIAISATSGDEALECMKTIVPDIILLDAASPLSKGFELGRRIKSMPTWSKIPILFMIERANPRQIINTYENGGVDYLSKPLSVPEVLVRLLTYVTTRVHVRQPDAPV